MAWTIEVSARVRKAFKKDIDDEIVRRMIAKLREAASLKDPKDIAKPMSGRLKGLWPLRIAGGYRILIDIQPARLVIVAVDAGHRRNIYEA